jgi:hypothetical protein
MIMQDVMCLVFVRIFWTRITFVLSPGLSPIEQLWDEIGRRARHHQNSPKTLQELRDALVHEWNNIPEAFIKRLIGSIRRRCEAVVAARGGHTRYWTPQTSILHDNFCLSMICSDNNVDKFCWYCLICHAHVYLNYTIFVEFFSLCTKYWAWISCIVFFLLTSIYSYNKHKKLQGPSWSWWSYGSLIYHYLFDQEHMTTTVVISNPTHGEMYSSQHYMIQFISTLCGFPIFLYWAFALNLISTFLLRQAGAFLWVLRFPPPIKLIRYDQLKYCWKWR